MLNVKTSPTMTGFKIDNQFQFTTSRAQAIKEVVSKEAIPVETRRVCHIWNSMFFAVESHLRFRDRENDDQLCFSEDLSPARVEGKDKGRETH